MPKATLNITCPVVPILISGLVHFSFAALALVGTFSPAYSFTHLVLVLMALWCSRDKISLEPVLAFIYVLVFSGIVDMIILGIYWDNNFAHNSNNRFYAAMVIINLLLKPTSFLFALFVVYTRNGGLDFTKFLKSFTSSDYHDIGGSVNVENGSETHDHD